MRYAMIKRMKRERKRERYDIENEKGEKKRKI